MCNNICSTELCIVIGEACCPGGDQRCNENGSILAYNPMVEIVTAWAIQLEGAKMPNCPTIGYSLYTPVTGNVVLKQILVHSRCEIIHLFQR